MPALPLHLTGLTKTFRGKRTQRANGAGVVTAIDDASLEVNDGEFIVLLGPSGCGKTTLLRSVAGLEEPDAGEIRIAGKLVFAAHEGKRRSLPTPERGLSMMFQTYALWPHMTVSENIGYPLEVRGVRRAGRRAQVATMLDMLGLPEIGDRYPNQISGGQQQRVALGRALIAESPLVLFDEPLSNVDARVRDSLRAEIAAMQRRLGFASLYVTHDQHEAFALGDRVAVLNAGRVQQLAEPRALYSCPNSLYVARFVGPTNEVAGTIRGRDGDHVVIDTEVGQLVGTDPVSELRQGDAVTAMFRPESCGMTECDDSSSLPSSANEWTGVVTRTTFEGATATHTVAVGSREFTALTVSTGTSDAANRKVAIRVEAANLIALKATA